MTQTEHTQARILDDFWSDLRRDPRTPMPPDVDPRLGELVMELEHVLRPNDLDLQFVSRLRARLLDDLRHDPYPNGTSRVSTIPASSPPGTIPLNLLPADDTGGYARPHRFREWTKLVAAIVVFVLVSGLLVAVFRGGGDDDNGDTVALEHPTSTVASLEPVIGGAGQSIDSRTEIVLPLDPSGGDNYKLHLVGLDGSIQRLTPEESEITGSETQPAWSPDGTKLVFTGYTRDGLDLFTINADGTGLTNLTNRPGQYLSPSWSPDGSSLVYIDGQNNGSWVTIASVDGSDVRQITHGSVKDSNPVWSPDGHSIAFLRFRWGPCKNVLPTPQDSNSSASYACEADPFTDLMVIQLGESRGRVLHTADDFGRDLRWSPDGRFLAFTSSYEDERVIVVSTDDGSSRVPIEGSTSMLPNWSADGQFLSVVVIDSGGSEAAIVAMNTDGTAQHSITDLHGWHAWSPDSSRIAVLQARYTMSGEGTGRANLYVVDADGVNRTLLLDDAAIGSIFAWRPEPAPEPDSETAIDPTPTSPTPDNTPEPSVNGSETNILTTALDVPAIVALPESYRLPTREAALAYVEMGLTDEQEVRSVSLVTVHDIHMEQANNSGPGVQAERMTSDTPVWRIEIEGQSTGMFRVPEESKARWVTTSWIRASDGFPYGLETGFDPEQNDQPQVRATPRPETETALNVDPREPLFPDAEVVHVVWTTEGNYFYPTGPDTSGSDLRSELWINRVSSDAVLRVSRTEMNGTLESLTVREDTTLTRFLAEAYNGATGEPYYTEFRTEALSTDDPAIDFGVPELDWYRIALARGWATVVGEREFEGQRVIEVQVAAGTSVQHIAYLHPDYLLPIAIVVTNGFSPEVNGVIQRFHYETIEGMSNERMPIWDLVTPDRDLITRVELDQELSLVGAKTFDGYPIFGLGGAFDEYRLAGILRHTEYDDNQGSEESDTVTFTYRQESDPSSVITIESIGDMRDDLRGDFIEQRLEVEEIALDDGPAWIAEYRTGRPVQVQMDREGTLIVIRGPDRATTIDMAENLSHTNP